VRHALETEEDAKRLRAPISEEETMFSTPDDTAALQTLFRAFPYPCTALYLRKGHGFFSLSPSIETARAAVESLF
jgi:hypothetical protein